MTDKNLKLEKLLTFLDDMHASDIKVIDVRSQTTVTDYMIICSGRSSRHVKSIASSVMEDMKAIDTPAISNTGLDVGDWALVDFGDYVLHVMQPESRSFYNIEGLWEE